MKVILAAVGYSGAVGAEGPPVPMNRRALRWIGGLFAGWAVAPFAAHANSAPLAPPVHLWGVGFDHQTVVLAAVVALLIYFLARRAVRDLSLERPGRLQLLAEMTVGAFDGLVSGSIGARRGRPLLAWIGTLFLFLLVGNVLNLLPAPALTIGGEAFVDADHDGRYSAGERFRDDNGNGRHDPGLALPAFTEASANLNYPLAMCLVFVAALAHGLTIRYQGLRAYLKEYFSPGGIMGVAMMPLNVVGKLAENISITFRLFGNLYGGAVILAVVGGLVHSFVLPIPMFAYFGVFAGTIQAFVFTMLATTYISMGVAEAEGEDAEAPADGERTD